MRRLLTLLLVLPLLALHGVAFGADQPTDSEIQAALRSPDSLVRHDTWERLNPEDSKQYKVIGYVLKKLPWFDREGAILALATAGTERTIQKMLRDLDRNPDPAVRQAMAIAFAKMDDERYLEDLFEALKDPHPAVRRMVVHGLGITRKSKEKVEALVDGFQTEDDPVVRSFYVNALNAQTLAYQGPDPRAWFTWWEEAKADPNYELGRTDEAALRKAEELGHKLKKRVTQSSSVTLETEERGRGEAVPILILPEYGHSKEVMIPFLSELERTHKLFYIDLPEIKSFKNLETITDKRIPYYPIDQLVEAFEELRKQTGQERFAIMACGLNSWIAMRYASLHPESVSHMVLVGPLSSRQAYGKATERMETQGKAQNDVELWHLALTRKMDTKTGESLHDKYHRENDIPKPPGEDASLDRRNWSLYFADERDSTIGMLYPKKSRWLGNVAIPDFRCFEEPRRNIPTIVIAGQQSILTSVDDCRAIAKHYGGQLYVYPKSSMMPFCEESEVFNKHMAALLRERVRRRS